MTRYSNYKRGLLLVAATMAVLSAGVSPASALETGSGRAYGGLTSGGGGGTPGLACTTSAASTSELNHDDTTFTATVGSQTSTYLGDSVAVIQSPAQGFNPATSWDGGCPATGANVGAAFTSFDIDGTNAAGDIVDCALTAGGSGGQLIREGSVAEIIADITCDVTEAGVKRTSRSTYRWVGTVFPCGVAGQTCPPNYSLDGYYTQI